MTKREAQEQAHLTNILFDLGISREDQETLRRIGMTLRRWYERECGDGNGCIERNEQTDQPYWLNASSGHKHPIPDRERGAEKRLKAVMSKYPTLTPYLQSDPRGAALYLLRPGDVPKGKHAERYYTNGVCVA